jgi:hypothetical protein
MIDIESYEPDPATFEVPDVPEVNVMLDALDDSVDQMDAVAGGESISLTASQRYLEGVLYANGVIPLNALQGNESIFGTIGGGIQAAWDWIVKMFKSVWNFFFGRDNAEEAETTKKEVDENNKEAQAAENGTQSDEDAKKQAGKMAAIASENGDEATAKALKEAKSPKEARAAIKAALAKIAKMNKKGRQKVEQSIKNAVAAKRGFQKIVNDDKNEKYHSATNTVASADHPVAHLNIELEAEIDKILVKDNTFIPLLEKALSLDTVPKVVAFGKTIQANVDAMKALGEAFNQRKGKMQTILTQTEARMKKAKEGKDKAELKKEVAVLRVIVNQAVKVAKLIEVSNHRLRTVHGDLIALFGL